MKMYDKEVLVSIYVCEVCGKESTSENCIRNCENEHKRKNCKHIPEFTLNDDYDSIEVVCSKCGSCINKYPNVSFEDIYDDQASLEKIYNIIKNASLKLKKSLE